MLSNAGVSKLRAMVREQGANGIQKTVRSSKALKAAGFSPADAEALLADQAGARELIQQLFTQALGGSRSSNTQGARRAAELGGQARPSPTHNAVAARTWTSADAALDRLSSSLGSERLAESSQTLRRRSLEVYMRNTTLEAEQERQRNRALYEACYGPT